MDGNQKNILLKQHNALTEARYEMSALEKNILYMVMAQIRDDDPAGKRYFISVQEIKKKLRRLGQEINLEDIQEATGKLVTRVYSFFDDIGDNIQMTLFSSVKYPDDSDLIRVEIISEVRKFMFDLKYDFTSFSLWSALRLRSIYSKRIYEMLSQHKDLKVFKISVQELRDRLKLTNKKLIGWTDFQKTVLDSPVKEINEKTELNTNYTLKKTGPKYTDIEFHIEKKEATGKDESGKGGVQGQLDLGV